MGHNVAFTKIHRRKNDRRGPILVRHWFKEEARKERLRQARIKKAEAVFPRPVKKLYPIVTCCSQRYNMKKRLGAGFSLAELKGANISVTRARQLGISVDKRRHNKSEESIALNVSRLQEYLKNIIIFNKNTPPEEIKAAIQCKTTVMPIQKMTSPFSIGSVAEQDTPDNVFKYVKDIRDAPKIARKERRKAALEAAQSKGKKK